jgi:hypothetical protein
MSTAHMQQQANFTSPTSANGNVSPAWDFVNTWVMYDGHTYPMLGVFMTPLTVTATSVTNTYDGQSYSGGNGVSYSTPPNLANLSGSLIYSGSSQGATNAGSYVITPSGLSALYSNQHGYNITYADGTLTISPGDADRHRRRRRAGSTAQANPPLSGSVTGLVGSDTLASGHHRHGEPSARRRPAASNVGSYAVTGSGLSANHGNYLFAQAPANAAALTIDSGDADRHRRSPSAASTARPIRCSPAASPASSAATRWPAATTGTAMAFSTPATSSQQRRQLRGRRLRPERQPRQLLCSPRRPPTPPR